MAMRLSGLMSNMDTESIIKQLVAAKQTKVDDVKRAQTKLQWKQDAWKELNAKITKLYNKTLNNMSFQDSYTKKITKVSNPNILSVITGKDAVNSVQSLKVDTLAQSGYLTGAKIGPAADGGEVKASSALVGDLGITAGSSFTVTTGGKATEITIDANTTVASLVKQLRDSGIGANFDAVNQRFFLNATDSGVANDFTLTASNSAGTDALSKLGILVYDNSAKAEYQKYADMATDPTKRQNAIDAEVAKRLASITSQKDTIDAAIANNQTVVSGLITDFQNAYGSDSDYNDLTQINKATLQADIDALEAMQNPTSDDTAKLNKLKSKMSFVNGYEEATNTLTQQHQQLQKVTTDSNGNSYLNADGTASNTLITEVTDTLDVKIAEAKDKIDNWNPNGGSADAHKTVGTDAVIYLNDAKFTSSTNTFQVNGLTLTVNATTAQGEAVTITTMDDTDGIYDMVKGFIKEYSALINEMDKLYNAESARGYEPLTDEEKDAMSESEVEKWETKIKDSILRRDDTLSSVSSAMKEIMSAGRQVNGKTMYLADFGIETLSYFIAGANEKNAYHIAGDPDDENTASADDVLKGMIASDPDTVVGFFTDLSKNMRSKMLELMQSTDYSSSFTVYEDKKMKEDYADYTTKIKDMEKKLQAYEDSWYAKFAKMETALAKMQSNANAVTSLLGG